MQHYTETEGWRSTVQGMGMAIRTADSSRESAEAQGKPSLLLHTSCFSIPQLVLLPNCCADAVHSSMHATAIQLS